MLDFFEEYNSDTISRIQPIFTSIFIIQNRMQTAGEKIQTEVTMKQWLLLAMTSSCKEAKTLSNVAKLMGCSRQNVKKLAILLEKKGYVNLTSSGGNAVHIELSDKVNQYMQEIGERHIKSLTLLFEDFTEEEIELLFNLYKKLYQGMERVERYAEELV